MREISEEMNVKSLLDYGCGKQSLKFSLPELNVIGYDPAIEGLDTAPEPSELVVCTDVLEHIEPELIDDVLNDISRLTIRNAFLVISTRPANKTLPDGRNAHLIQKPISWWAEKLEKRFRINIIQNFSSEFMVLVNK